MDKLKGALFNSLFDWARVWGLTTTTLVTDFVGSLCFPFSYSSEVKSFSPQCASFVHIE